ncbi:MAG: hypothetical protein GW949_05300 [Spirochaetales bacterium]|nr:hypothetical protein [Spirochaetales bacterium]
MRSGIFFLLILLTFGFWAFPLFAAPGDLLSLEYERTYSPNQVREFIGPLYAGFEIPPQNYPVQVYEVVYESTYPDGTPARAYAQVFLPEFPESPTRSLDIVRPLYVFGPGSTGLLDVCRPSREHEAGIRWGLYRAHVLSHASQGFIGIIPDYLGFRDPERDQYYMVAQAEAAVMLDAFRTFSAIRRQAEYPHGARTRNFTAGFSQGGHAAFAAGDFRASYAPEVRLEGIIGYGPTTDPQELMLQYPSVSPMMIYTYSQLYGSQVVDPTEIFRPEFAEYLADDVLSQCVGGMQSTYPSRAKDLYTPEFHKALVDRALDERYPGIYRVLVANSTGYGVGDTDVLVLQGRDDIVIRPEVQEVFVGDLKGRGIRVDFVMLEDQRHDTRQAGFARVQDWVRSRL